MWNATQYRGGMAELRVTGLGASVTVRAEDPATQALLPRIAHSWSWCLADESAATTVDGGTVVIPPVFAGDEDGLLQRLTQSITQALIAARAGQIFLFHAAAICHPDTGATVMAVAPGNTGKTTLAVRFGRRYAYLTDETAAVDDGGRIVWYPKPLSVRREGLPKQETSPDDLGLVRPRAEPYLAAVILLDRERGSQRPIDVLELPLLDAVAAMAPESSSLSAMSNPLRRLRNLLAPVEPVLRVTYGEVDQLGRLLDELVGTP